MEGAKKTYSGTLKREADSELAEFQGTECFREISLSPDEHGDARCNGDICGKL